MRPRQRAATFLDRTAEYGLVEQHRQRLQADSSHLRVFEVMGFGGFGKSRFLAEVRDRFASLPDPPTLVSVALEREASMSATAPLLAIRNQVRADCWLFDAALLTYWAVTDQARQPIATESLAMQLVAQVGELAHLSLPLTFAADVYAATDVSAAVRRGYDRNEFAAIDALREDERELFANLPDYLGIDLRRRDRRLVVFYDGYDQQAARTLAGGARWLRRFIRTLGSGLHLLAAREGLGWDAAEWEPFISRLVLDQLPETECRKMIRRELGDHLGRDVEDRLVAASRRIPFYLHTSIDACRAEIHAHGAVQAGDLPSSPPDSLERLLDHLSSAERTLIVVLAAVQYFDAALYQQLVRAFDLTGAIDMPEFAEWFFVTEAGRGLFRTHDLLTDEVRTAEDLAATT